MSQPVAPEPAATPQPTPAAPVVVRVNLLPRKFLDQAQVRRAQGIAAVCILGAAVVTGGLWLWARSEVNAAQERVNAAQATNSQLVAEAAQYASVPEAYAIVDRANAELSLAMAPEVRWSFVLNDLSLTIPTGVGLTTMDVTTTGVVPPPNPDPTLPGQAIGAVSYGGEATSYPKVSEWLDSQAKQVLYTNVYLSSAAKAEQSGQVTVTFASTADITDVALSRRYSATTTTPTAG